MSTVSTGVCQCTGQLRKKTYGEAWAVRGILDPVRGVGNADCYQCDKCDTIYHVTVVTTSDIKLDETKASKKEFGTANGRA